MNVRKALGLTAISLAALALSACAGGGSDATPPAGNGYGDPTPSETAMTSPTAAATTPAATAGVGLMTASSSLGDIVTDSAGMTVYMFDSDTQGSGTSTCSGGCLSAWPPVPAGTGAPDTHWRYWRGGHHHGDRRLAAAHPQRLAALLLRERRSGRRCQRAGLRRRVVGARRNRHPYR